MVQSQIKGLHLSTFSFAGDIQGRFFRGKRKLNFLLLRSCFFSLLVSFLVSVGFFKLMLSGFAFVGDNSNYETSVSVILGV